MCYTPAVEFEWDENKRSFNLLRHGIDFEDAISVWDGPVLEIPSARQGEERLVGIGWFDGRMIAVVFTWRGKKRRIISARIARKNEREDYNEAVGYP